MLSNWRGEEERWKGIDQAVEMSDCSEPDGNANWEGGRVYLCPHPSVDPLDEGTSESPAHSFNLPDSSFYSWTSPSSVTTDNLSMRQISGGVESSSLAAALCDLAGPNSASATSLNGNLSLNKTAPFRRSLPSLLPAQDEPVLNGQSGIRRTSRCFVIPRHFSEDTGESLLRPPSDGLDRDVSPLLMHDARHRDRSKTLVQRAMCVSDEETETASSISSSLARRPTNRKRLHQSQQSSSTSGSKRQKTVPPGQSPADWMNETWSTIGKDEADSASSGEELERFFDSMGLDDGMTGQGRPVGVRSGSRGMQLSQQVSDDAMDSEEEQLESVSIIGAGPATLAGIETDDDESQASPNPPLPNTQSPSDSSSKMAENSLLRNARIYKWLVTCRDGVPVKK